MVIYSTPNMIPFKDLHKKKCAAKYMNVAGTQILGISECTYERLRIDGCILRVEDYTIQVYNDVYNVYFDVPKVCFKGARK